MTYTLPDHNPDIDITYDSVDRPSCIYKSCINSSRFDEYEAAFHLEYTHMKQLQDLMEQAGEKELYASLFPVYHLVSRNSRNEPYICMDYVPGLTLENILQQRALKNGGPSRLLQNREILHIFTQLCTAFKWLYKGDMLQLDLFPQNIVVKNRRFDISLIDFTNCYYPSLQHTPYNRRQYNRIDYRINPESSPSVQLKESCALLFTRLFFGGNSDYARYCCLNAAFPLGRTTIAFFQENYPLVLDCLLYPKAEKYTDSVDPILALNDWIDCLSKSMDI